MEFKEDLVGGLDWVSCESKSIPLRSADDSTVVEDVKAQLIHAATDMPALSASNTDMGKKAVLSRSEVLYGMCPKYLRYNLWDHEQSEDSSPIAKPFCLAD